MTTTTPLTDHALDVGLHRAAQQYRAEPPAGQAAIFERAANDLRWAQLACGVRRHREGTT